MSIIRIQILNLDGKIMKKALFLILAFVMLGNLMLMQLLASENETNPVLLADNWENINTDLLCNTISVTPGQLIPENCTVSESDIYGYIINYPLKKGHTLSISDENYVFSVRKLTDGNYSTLLKQATADSFTATEDMTVAMLVRKPDRSILTEEELNSIVIYDSQYGMIGVEGYANRFTVEADTIDSNTVTTRALLILPINYSDTGDQTPIILHAHGRTGFVNDSQWCGNKDTHIQLIANYLNAGYAVFDVDNTELDTAAADLGCPQLVSSYLQAYEYIQQHFNVEKKISIHSRSFGTFAALRVMREIPELVKCAVMTGPWVSMESVYSYNAYRKDIALKFGFSDNTGNSYEAEKLVGYDPYTDIDTEEYWLPPTFWMMAQNDANANNMHPAAETFISKLNDLGCITQKEIYDTDHTGVCSLNSAEMTADALAFLDKYQGCTAEHYFDDWEIATEATCRKSGLMYRYCVNCNYYESMEIPPTSAHICKEDESYCVTCGASLERKTNTLSVIRGQFYDTTGEWLYSDVYGCIIDYELKAGHTLSLSDENYVFSVRILSDGNYLTMLKAATGETFTAEKDMTVAIRVRKPDKTTITDEELADIFLYETYYVERTENETAQVDEWNIDLSDNIGVNFYMNVQNADFTIDGSNIALQGALQTDGTYKYTVDLAAAQMTDEITICVNGVTLDKTYSVRKYADTILADETLRDSHDLVKAMLVYGAASQTYFEYNMDAMADEGIAFTQADPAGNYDIALEGNVTGLHLYGATLLHKNKIAMRFYFTAESLEGLTFTAGEAILEPTQKDCMYYIDVTGINPQQLGEDVAIVVSNGTDSLRICYNPMAYIIRVFSKTETGSAINKLVKALYNYYQAATRIN